MSIGVSGVYVEDPQGSVPHTRLWAMEKGCEAPLIDLAGISHLRHVVPMG